MIQHSVECDRRWAEYLGRCGEPYTLGTKRGCECETLDEEIGDCDDYEVQGGLRYDVTGDDI